MSRTLPNSLRTHDASDFVIGDESFGDLEFRPGLKSNLHLIYNKTKSASVKRFVLAAKPQVECICRVTIIEKDGRLTPRLSISVRDTTGRIRTVKSRSRDGNTGSQGKRQP
jgi:hypothetical protein